MPTWIDTHCHLDAPEFAPDRDVVRAAAQAAGVTHLVIPAVQRSHWQDVIALAHRHGDSYALGIHPLYTPGAQESDIAALRELLSQQRGDPHLVAVGEIGLDFFVPGLDEQRQIWFYEQQIRLACEFELPVILHVRKSSDRLLKTLRQHRVVGGIAHAFNGSAQQAQAFIDMGFKLGFGGAVTYERALKLRELAASLPLEALVLETDAPDIPPHWLYTTAEQRAAGQPQGRNSSAELPRIAVEIARLRGIGIEQLAQACTANARKALKGLPALP
ncbi:TatD family hydrolase [Comamonas thiooxydans]|uniref:TatD family hydrolase n=1 Tax=Comamonas thiooxydans TaxID=363952 RepID=UPI0020CDC375|nr:TatD family hydrolase [Comamonas thiooxydans]BDR07513.1 TatD family hydrolase [Comamonas thiooxydans]